MSTAVTESGFAHYASGFEEVVGDQPRLSLVAEVDAHEGPVYFADENGLCFTTLPRRGHDDGPDLDAYSRPDMGPNWPVPGVE